MGSADLSRLSLNELTEEYARRSRELEREAVALAYEEWEEHVQIVVSTVRNQVKGGGSIADCKTPTIPSLSAIALGKLDKLLKQSRGSNGTMA